MKTYRTESLTEALHLVTEWAEDIAIIHISKEPWVLTGKPVTLDLDACRKYRLQVGRAEYFGGTIVHAIGDLSIGINTWGRSDLAPQIFYDVKEWLQSRGLNISEDKNDLLVDDKKVVSWARVNLRSGWTQSGIHFSIGPVNLEMIKDICDKPMVKIPGSLGEYEITAEDILEEINKFFE